MASEAKIDRAVIAAADQFIRYGFARTTMGDIARAADMSRPALYLLFPGKEELFEAAVTHLNRIRMAEIRGALTRARNRKSTRLNSSHSCASRMTSSS